MNLHHRAQYTLYIGLTIVLGLASRRLLHVTHLPFWLAKDPGDVLYATMMYWLCRLARPNGLPERAAGVAFGICAAIEFFKLWQLPSLDRFRHTTAGHLILGTGFHASNIVCYAIGAAIGLAIDRVTRSTAAQRTTE